MKKLEALVKKKNSMLCVGLDLNKVPDDAIYRLIDETIEYTVAYKFNLGFWLDKVDLIYDLSKHYLEGQAYVLLDGKFSDIESTMTSYARMAYKEFLCDGATVTPFMGGKGVQAFLEAGDTYVVVAPSNDALSKEYSLSTAYNYKDTSAGLVVGGTNPDLAKEIREICPNNWFLCPGVGAQRADMNAFLPNAVREDKLGVIYNVSRSIIHSEKPKESARQFRDLGNQAIGL